MNIITPDTPLLRAENIVKTFYEGSENELEILHGINLEVKRGEFVSIVGASGSGKSTLMNILGLLDKPTSGNYYLNGENMTEAPDKSMAHLRNRSIGFVFQNYNLIARTEALDNVELPMLYAGIHEKERRGESQGTIKACRYGKPYGPYARYPVRWTEAESCYCKSDGQ